MQICTNGGKAYVFQKMPYGENMIIAIVCCVLLFLNAIFKKNKLLFITSLFVMWSIMTFITKNADEALYISRYYNSSVWSFNTEIFFQLINTVCNKMGLTFVQYKGVVSYIYISLIGFSIWKLSKYPNIILVLFFLCPFPLNASQLRFALSSACLIFAYRYLIDEDITEKKKKDCLIKDMKFVVMIIIATFIHSAAIVWIMLLVIKRITVKQTIIFTSIAFVFVYYIFNPVSISWLLSVIGAKDRMMAYFSIAYQQSEFRHFGAMAVTVVFISAMTILCCLVCKRKKKKSSPKNIEQLLKINIFSVVVLSFIFRYTAEMYRIQEGLMLLNYILLLNEVDYRNLLKIRAEKRDMLIQFILFFLVIGSLILKVLLYTNYDYVWIPMFYI